MLNLRKSAMHFTRRVQIVNVVLLILGCQISALSENKLIVPVSAGVCEPPIPDAQGDVTFLCHGLSSDQVRLLPRISTVLDKLLLHDPAGVPIDSKLDKVLTILEGAPEPKPEQVPIAELPAASKSRKEVISYDYRGYKKSSKTGTIQGDEGESRIYQKLLTRQKSSEWKILLKEASRELKKTPEWLTPYAFEAVALFHLGKKDEAIAVLEFVDRHSVGNHDYDQVRHMLSQARRAPPSTEIPTP